MNLKPFQESQNVPQNDEEQQRIVKHLKVSRKFETAEAENPNQVLKNPKPLNN